MHGILCMVYYIYKIFLCLFKKNLVFSTSVGMVNLKCLAGSSCKDFLCAGNFCSSSIILVRFICLADILKQMYKQISWATLVTSIKKIYSVLSRNVIKNRRESSQVTGELLCEGDVLNRAGEH